MYQIVNAPEHCESLARQIGKGWRIRVLGLEEACWLRDELLKAEFDCSKISKLLGTSMFLFTCRPQGDQESFAVVDQIRRLPSVTLQIAPASA